MADLVGLEDRPAKRMRMSPEPQDEANDPNDALQALLDIPDDLDLDSDRSDDEELHLKIMSSLQDQLDLAASEDQQAGVEIEPPPAQDVFVKGQDEVALGALKQQLSPAKVEADLGAHIRIDDDGDSKKKKAAAGRKQKTSGPAKPRKTNKASASRKGDKKKGARDEATNLQALIDGTLEELQDQLGDDFEGSDGDGLDEEDRDHHHKPMMGQTAINPALATRQPLTNQGPDLRLTTAALQAAHVVVILQGLLKEQGWLWKEATGQDLTDAQAEQTMLAAFAQAGLSTDQQLALQVVFSQVCRTHDQQERQAITLLHTGTFHHFV